jgi:hypothetical protein
MACNPVPTQVSALGADVVRLVAGELHACALKADGSIWCWGGYSEFGVLGGTGAGERTCSMDRLCVPTPVEVAGTVSNVADLSSSALARHTCALTAAEQLSCWGLNNSRQLGDDTIDFSAAPLRAAPQVAVVAGSLGSGHTCALDTTGQAFCWGANDIGQLGDGTHEASAAAVQVAALDDGSVPGGVAVQLVSGGSHNCARREDDTVWCWGANRRGELGIGADQNDASRPRQVAPLGAEVTDIAVGTHHSCAIKRDGSLHCWGENTHGQLGDGTTDGEPCDADRLCRWLPVRSLLSCP